MTAATLVLLISGFQHAVKGRHRGHPPVETAKINGQEPYAYLRHILERLPQVNSVEVYEALLPWNCSSALAS